MKKYVILIFIVIVIWGCGFNYNIQQLHTTNYIATRECSMGEIYHKTNVWMLERFDESEMKYNVLKDRIYILGKREDHFIQVQIMNSSVVISIVPPDVDDIIIDDYKNKVLTGLNKEWYGNSGYRQILQECN